MKFRFTPVVLFLFLSALLAVGAFSLWTAYRGAYDALHLEQLGQIERTHDLAEQRLNHRLSEAVQVLETLPFLKNNIKDQYFLNQKMEKSIWDFAVRFKKNAGEEKNVEETYGVVDERFYQIAKRDRYWGLVETHKGIALCYQYSFSTISDTGEQTLNVLHAGIYLSANTPLLNEMSLASNANAHHLVHDNRVLTQTASVDDGVTGAADYVLYNQQPKFSGFDSLYSADMRPLRIENGQRGLFLLSVVTTDGLSTWREDFRRSIVQAILFIVVSAAAVTFILRAFIRRSLDHLLDYAQMVNNGDVEAEYLPGEIIEFNKVGLVLEKMVTSVSENGKYIADLVQSSNAPIVAWDKDGVITIFNNAAQDLFRYSGGVPYRFMADFLKGQKNLAVQKACLDAMDGKPTQSLEIHLRHNGDSKYILWSISPLRDVTGRGNGALAHGQDITARRQAERHLDLFARVFGSTREAIMITDAKGIIIEVNTAFCDITGYAREEVIGQNPRIMKSGRHDQEFYKNMWASLIDNGIWRGEIWDKKKNGDIYPKWLSISVDKDKAGNVRNYIAVFSDITGKKADEERLEQLAHFDPLTTLPNRVLFHDRLKTALARAKRDQQMIAVLFVDLDKFKQVNDSLGHRVGDKLLKEVSGRLQESVREIDTVARLSGDEFTVILTDVNTPQDIEVVAGRIVSSVGAPYVFEGHELFISASVGIAVYPDDGDSSANLLRHADIAMYHAKEKGRNNYQFFNAGMNDHAQAQLSLANQLRLAMNKNEIKCHYQLKVDCFTGQPVGVEALARWETTDGDQISPAKFIPVAEEHGLIVRLGGLVMRQACVQVRRWRDMGFDFGRVAVNLSAQQFRDQNLLSDIQEAMEDNGVRPSDLAVEVTENMMMEDVEGAIAILNDLKELGLEIAIDDFGTGYSSLNYLKRFPVDTLKIDRSFIKDLCEDKDDEAIVSAIVSLAQKLDIDVVAEGAEEKGQIDFLQSVGCRIVQGFYYAKPCKGGELPIVWQETQRRF